MQYRTASAQMRLRPSRMPYTGMPVEGVAGMATAFFAVVADLGDG